MKKLTSVFLTLLILLGNLQLTHASHHCGGLEVKSAITFGQQTLSCGMENTTTSCELKDKHNHRFENKNCCRNTFTTYTLDSEFHSKSKNEHQTLSFKKSEFLILDLLIFENIESKVSTPFTPLLLDKDNQVLFQTFLI